MLAPPVVLRFESPLCFIEQDELHDALDTYSRLGACRASIFDEASSNRSADSSTEIMPLRNDSRRTIVRSSLISTRDKGLIRQPFVFSSSALCHMACV